MKKLPPLPDNPVTADQRFADAVESLVSNPADRAFLLVTYAMGTKSHRLDARRSALAENAEYQWEKDCARIAGAVERDIISRGESV